MIDFIQRIGLFVCWSMMCAGLAFVGHRIDKALEKDKP